MAFIIIDRTTEDLEVDLQTVIINGQTYRLLYTGKIRTVSEEMDTYLKFPHIQSPLRRDEIKDSLSAAKSRLSGTGLDARTWKIHHVRRQYRDRIDHLDLLLILPRTYAAITFKFSRRGNLDFVHRDAEKFYLGIHLNSGETPCVKPKEKGSSYLSTAKSNKGWKLIHPPIFSCSDLRWRSTKTVTA